ncbi:MAG: ABC transporter permease [Clostridia bacterium]|nr:ABC transporter permease [Clostridia bacterium]
MLLKKMLRDILKNKSQFITIFLMVFLAVFAFAGVHAYMDGMTASADVYYNNQNLQDLWITSENFTDEKIEDIKKIDNVKDVERYIRIKANVNGSDKYTNPMTNKKLDDLVFECNFIESNNISKMYVIDGEGYSKDKSGLWLDYYLAKNIGIKVGDEIELSMEGVVFQEKVMGLVETPDHVYFMKDETAIFPTHTDFGIAYMSINEFPKEYIYNKILDKMGIDSANIDNKEEFLKSNIPNFKVEEYYAYPYAIVDVDDVNKLNETKTKIKDDIDGIITATTREEDISWDGYQREAEEGETYSGVFSGLFVFIAILSVVTTMNRFVRKERIQIGTLKALGFKKGKITSMYVGYGLFISIVASILGIILGNLVIGNTFLEMEMSYYEIPYYHIVTKPIVYYVSVGIIAAVTFVTYLSCRKVLKEPAAEALRIERPKIKVRENSFTTKKFFNKLSLSSKWNVRDIARSKGRTLMALVGIAGCTMLVVTAFGMLDSMKAYMDWEFGTINHFEYKLNLSEDYTENQYDDIINKYGNKTSQTVGVEFKNNDEIIMKPLTINDASDMLQVTDHNRKAFKMNDDGLYITEKMSATYNLKVGDEVEWHIINSDKWHKSKIAGLNRDPQSQQFNCSKGYFDTLEAEYKADSLYTNEDLSGVKDIPGVNTIQTINNLKDGMNSMLGMMYSLIALLIVVSIILACVIIFNLGSLSFGEKEYQFATLKVLGFKNAQIKKIFVKQNLWISIFAIIVALPAGNFITDYIFKNAIGDTYDFSAMIKPITFIASAIGTYVVAYVVNQFLGRKIKKLDMVTSLKGNE